MASSIQEYKQWQKHKGDNHYDRSMKRKSREFVNYFNNTLNKESCSIDGVETSAVFQDHSQSNNKDLSDDKYIIVPNTTQMKVGSYVRWRDSPWLVFTEEFKTIPSHQQAKIKQVNEQIKWLDVDGKICNNGVGYSAYVQNQTLYTLGVSFTGSHLALVNAKMMMYMQDNEETRSLKVQDRIFIGENVYNVMFMDTVSRKGLINYLLEQDTFSPEYDNFELRIADYYKKRKDDDDTTDPDDENEVEIIGDDKARIGRTYVFKASEEDSVAEWNVEFIEAESPLVIQERSETSITVRVKDDSRVVGTTVNIIATLKSGKIINKPILIISKF